MIHHIHKIWLNCVFVAFLLWFKGRMRGGLGVRRSIGLKGLIPHFFHIKERGREIIVVDYIPRRRKTKVMDAGDSFLLFDGVYRAKVYYLVSTSTSDTLWGAYRGIVEQKRSARKYFG